MNNFNRPENFDFGFAQHDHYVPSTTNKAVLRNPTLKPMIQERHHQIPVEQNYGQPNHTHNDSRFFNATGGVGGSHGQGVGGATFNDQLNSLKVKEQELNIARMRVNLEMQEIALEEAQLSGNIVDYRSRSPLNMG